MQEMTLFIGGDLVPTKTNFKLFSQDDATKLLGEDLLKILADGDLRIFNLETPLTNNENPIVKCGPNLIAPEDTVRGIHAIGTNIVGLANNHILDQGDRGLSKTIELLDNNNILHLGAGENLAEAAKALVIEMGDKVIGFYACAEREFTIAGKNKPGANPFEPMESLDHISKLKEKCNHVIILYHGGKEHYRYPSPQLQYVCRRLIDKGADLVVCQHSHCIGCREHYQNGNIIYGQGNFIFDFSESDFWQTSLLLKIIINDKMEIKEIPIKKCGNRVSLAKDREGEKIIRNYYLRSKQIQQQGFVEEEYTKFARNTLNLYLSSFMGKSLLVRILNKILRGNLGRLLFNVNGLLVLQNYIECESHRELLIYGLKDSLLNMRVLRRKKCFFNRYFRN